MLRAMIGADIDQLLTIEQSVHVTPWDWETFHACLQSGYPGWVIEIDKNVIGFIIISLSFRECHILNLCVMHACQRQGLGRQLLNHALDYAHKRGLEMAYLEVRRSNLNAISLYEKMHFQLIGERKHYYPAQSGAEDALIFAISLRPIYNPAK